MYIKYPRIHRHFWNGTFIGQSNCEKESSIGSMGTTRGTWTKDATNQSETHRKKFFLKCRRDNRISANTENRYKGISTNRKDRAAMKGVLQSKNVTLIYRRKRNKHTLRDNRTKHPRPKRQKKLWQKHPPSKKPSHLPDIKSNEIRMLMLKITKHKRSWR